jgi:uncharacterized protein
MEQSLRVSQFNIVVDVKDNTVAVFNGVTGALTELSAGDERILSALRCPGDRAIDVDPEIAATCETLRGVGVLIDEDFDEVAFLHLKYLAGRFDTSRLDLLVTLTYDCDFRCLYCSEKRQSVYLNDDVERGIVELVRNRVNCQGIRRLALGWFGGEPLLCKDQIRRMSKELVQIAEEKGVRIRATLTTNGYGFSRSFMDELPAMRIGTVVVTLDGPPHIHDQRRFLAGRLPTCEKIVENLHYIMDRLEGKVDLEIRTNLDLENITQVEETLSYLHDFREQAHFSWSFVNNRTGRGKSYAAQCIDSDVHRKEIGAEVAALFSRMGFNTPHLPQRRANFCMGDMRDGFAIDPVGRVYKCNAGVIGQGCNGGPVGRILPTGQIDFDMEEFLAWYAFDALEDEECRHCWLLPYCMGGCPLLSIHGGKAPAIIDRGKQCVLRSRSTEDVMEEIKSKVAEYYHWSAGVRSGVAEAK